MGGRDTGSRQSKRGQVRRKQARRGNLSSKPFVLPWGDVIEKRSKFRSFNWTRSRGGWGSLFLLRNAINFHTVPPLTRLYFLPDVIELSNERTISYKVESTIFFRHLPSLFSKQGERLSGSERFEDRANESIIIIAKICKILDRWLHTLWKYYFLRSRSRTNYSFPL